MFTNSFRRRTNFHIGRLMEALRVFFRHGLGFRLSSLALVCFFYCALTYASEPLASFDQANKLYEEGKYRDAAKSYRDLLRQGRVSPALFFNLGNSLFKSGQVGRAIICYRLAEQLSPRDPDIKANLQFARDSVVGGTSRRAKALWRFLRVLTIDELTVLVTCAGWVWFSLLTVKELRPALGQSLGVGTKSAAACSILLGLWLAVVLNAHFRAVPSVVVANEAVVRYGPFDESQSFFTLRDGSELTILDQKNNWLQVKDRSGRMGWLRSDQVTRVAPESALESS